jgi:hypothetical protein
MPSCFHSSTENSLYIDAVALTLTVEIDNRIIRPESPLDFVTSYDFAVTFKEQSKYLKNLFPEKNPVLRSLHITELPSREIEFKRPETN